MRVLIVAATLPEIEPLLTKLNLREGKNEYNNHPVSVLITGVGMVATAFELGRHLANSTYHLAINLGIAGSFDRNLALGEVVNITDDRFAELGAEDGENFLAIDELGFGEQNTKANYEHFNFKILKTLAQATAITVNTVHGNESRIAKTLERFKPQTESMEGAAFFYGCEKVGLPCIQARAISNYVERRNRNNWNIGHAVKNLNIFATEFINALPSP